MATSKNIIVQLIWTTFICGRILLVSCKATPPLPLRHQSFNPNAVNAPVSSKVDTQYGGREADNEYAIGKTKGFELKHGYSFNLGTSPQDGMPVSRGWTYLGGSFGDGPNYYSDDTGFLTKDIWSGYGMDVTKSALYASAAAVALSSLLYTFAPYFTSSPPTKSSSTKSSSKKKTTPPKVEIAVPSPTSDLALLPPPAPAQEPEKEEAETKNQDIIPDVEPQAFEEEVVANKVSKSKKIRRKRATTSSRNQIQTVQNSSLFGGDADLTRLASIVLNAITSGECMQKTICQLGSQIGESPKGRIAFNLVDTLLPQSVHANQYFVTMKKALRGENICDKFNCHYQTYQ